MSNLFVCFLMAACEDKQNLGTVQSVLSSLLEQKNIPSIKMEGITSPSLCTLCSSVGTEKLVDEISNVSSIELTHEFEDEQDMSAIHSRGKINK